MLSMLRAVASPRSRSRVLTALFSAVLAFAPATLRAETGSALPQGYTNDIPNAGAANTPRVGTTPVQQVDDGDDEAAPADEFADDDPSALTDFQEPLASYGTWVDDGTYGTVWVPSAAAVGADFAPYQTAGHWAVADTGDWMWVSDYDWGYIPFHYGRWVWIAGRGWAWIPGRTYAPAWVVWRVGDGGYLGWAPMPPTWYWSGGVAVGLWTTPYAAYCFVPTAYVFHHHVHTYVVRDAAVVRQVAATTHTYRPASPQGGVHAAGKHGAHKPASPSFKEAGIPSSSAPKSFVKADPRARAFATKSSTASVRRVTGGGGLTPHAGGAQLDRGGPARAQRSPFGADSAVRRNTPSAAPRGDARAPAPQGSHSSSGYPRGFQAPTPSGRGSGFQAPAPSGRGSGFQAPAPSGRAPTSHAPSPSAPAVRAPTFHAPSSSAPTFRAPSRSAPSAPSVHVPSPSRSSSSPSRSAPSSRGGGSHGGGHRR